MTEHVFDQDDPEVDEVLEIIWLNRENNLTTSMQDLREKLGKKNLDESLKVLLRHRLILESGDQIFSLTATGDIKAGAIIRRHRLAEKLFSEVFKLSEAEWEQQACKLEHERVLSAAATDSVCSFLGHPRACPHGRPIPRGDCCRQFRSSEPLVSSLKIKKIGGPYTVAYVDGENSLRLAKLAHIGVVPGKKIFLDHKKPTFVLRLDETELALDEDAAQAIFVRNG